MSDLEPDLEEIDLRATIELQLDEARRQVADLELEVARLEQREVEAHSAVDVAFEPCPPGRVSGSRLTVAGRIHWWRDHRFDALTPIRLDDCLLVHFGPDQTDVAYVSHIDPTEGFYVVGHSFGTWLTADQLSNPSQPTWFEKVQQSPEHEALKRLRPRQP